MAAFQDHIDRAKSNFLFLEKINSLNNSPVDWQVTVCFYTALHIVNAYLAKEGDIHYTKHKDIRLIIWFDNETSPFKIDDENVCLSYRALENLSRRSRYMCHDDSSLRYSNENVKKSFLTNEKHLVKAVKNLDKIITYFNKKYSLEFPSIKFVSSELPLENNFSHFYSNK